MEWFESRNISFTFYDVEQNEDFAEALRNLYESRKLNFPTILGKDKKLRNPRTPELEKWLAKRR